MKFSVFVSLLLLSLASSAPFSFDDSIVPADRHVIKHKHEINCRNCFCGDKAIERARHECSNDRDLVLCPPTVLKRMCYRCSCYPRVPISPSPVVLKPHSEERSDRDDEKHADDDHKHNDHDRKHDDEGHMHDGEDHKHDDADHKHDDENGKHDKGHQKHGTGDHKHVKEESEHEKDDRKDEKDDKEDDMMMPTPEYQPSSTSMRPKPSQPVMTPAPRECATFERGGGGGNTMFDVDLLHNSGVFTVSWRMNDVPDKVEIFYEGRKIFTTVVPVSGRGTAYVMYSGMSSVINVWVSSPKSGTGWFMRFGCPE